jgi:hypothetical protein
LGKKVNSIDYRAIAQNLRSVLLQDGKPVNPAIRAKIGCRLAALLEVDPDQPLAEILAQLERKWQQDGLLRDHSGFMGRREE